MPSTKRLIVNADDFGQSTGINDGVIEAFERGVVRSASLMVRWPAAAEAARYAKAYPDLSVGLHLDLGEFTYRQSQWVPLYEVVRREDHAAVESEISRQFSTFNELMGRNPTHIDSHQHAHRAESVYSVVRKIADEIDAPLRLYSDVRYCGAFYGQTNAGTPLLDNITLDALMKLLMNLDPGITELGCHPAKRIDFDTMYSDERVMELQVLCDSRVPEFLAENHIELCSFATISKLLT
jgi:chitin disaccharide deacetylase